MLIDPGQQIHSITRRNRWYDALPFVPDAIQMTANLPVEVQQTIAQVLNERVDNYMHGRDGRELKSLGVPKVLGLYNNQNKKRWYDENVHMRRAMSLIVAIPEEQLSEVCARIIHVAKVLEEADKRAGQKFTGAALARSSVMREVENILYNREVPILIQRAGDLHLVQMESYHPEDGKRFYLPDSVGWDKNASRVDPRQRSRRGVM